MGPVSLVQSWTSYCENDEKLAKRCPKYQDLFLLKSNVVYHNFVVISDSLNQLHPQPNYKISRKKLGSPDSPPHPIS